MRNDRRCPKEVRKAIRAFARAVRLVADMADLPGPDPLSEYHAKEYLDEMETLLVHQLLTAFSSCEERRMILASNELDYLMDRIQFTEKEWSEQDDED